jgi:hypothetical protein
VDIMPIPTSLAPLAAASVTATAAASGLLPAGDGREMLVERCDDGHGLDGIVADDGTSRGAAPHGSHQRRPVPKDEGGPAVAPVHGDGGDGPVGGPRSTAPFTGS